MIHVTNHFIPEQAAVTMEFLNRMAPQHIHILAWGAPRWGHKGFMDRYALVDYEPKFAVKYQKIRMGSAFLRKVHQMRYEGPVLITEYDHVTLRRDYADYVLDPLSECDFVGIRCGRHGDASNWGQLDKRLSPAFMDYLSDVSVREDKTAIYGSQGNAMAMRHDFVQAFGETEHFPMMTEIYFPTLAHHLGFRVGHYPRHYEAWLKPGHRDYDTDGVVALLEGGAPFCHPFKEKPMELYNTILAHHSLEKLHEQEE